jgi:hypothetical protein
MSTTKNLRRTIAATVAFAAAGLLTAPLHAQFGLSISIGATSSVPPPPLPEYDQPEAPGDGYIWTPGYWAWDDQVDDYYWVPGTWVLAPQPGLLWTPGYWAYDNGYYGFHNGYWGEHVGFYGGVNYGFGYFGTGYEGGYWNGNRFFYNTAINRINLTIVHNTYIRPMRPEWNNRSTRFAFNGPGGINVRPSRGEEMAFREHHVDPTGFQRNQQDFARQDRVQFAGFNHGAPPAAATPRPVQNVSGFRQGAAPAHGAPTGANGFNRGGGFNGNRGGFDNRGGDSRFNDNNRGNMTQGADPRSSEANTNGGRSGFQGAAPVQPGQASGQGNNFRPGDGSFRLQQANPLRMAAPQDDNGSNDRFHRGQGGQTGPVQQQRPFQQMQQPAQQQQPAGQQPLQQRPLLQQPAQQPMQQRQFQQQPGVPPMLQRQLQQPGQQQPQQRQFQQQPAQQFQQRQLPPQPAQQPMQRQIQQQPMQRPH